ncbi:MAG: helix-turn-helix domain-containing protein [Planctomycetota bacterium]
MKDLCSTGDAARALGVSESSVRRWVDGGALRSERTAGGHRRVLVADLVRYARERGLQWRRPELVQLEELAAADCSEVELLFEAFRTADLPRASQLVVGPFVDGRGLDEIFDELVAPAMAQVGELWRGGIEGILAEHRATSVGIGLIRRLRELLPNPKGLPAIGGAVEGDPYSMPSQMAETLLRANGFDAFDLGPNTPIPVIAAAALERKARVAWVSANAVQDPVVVREQILEAVAECGPRGVTFVLGGRRSADLQLPLDAGVRQVASMRGLQRIATEIVGAPD